VEAGIEPYDQDYFDSFARNANSFLGQALMQARVDFVAEHYQGSLIDIGIGSGAFIEARRHTRPMRPTFGYDVNPAGVEWLQRRRLFADPYAAPFEAATMWDVLEHMPDYPTLLANVREWLFLSLPIFSDAAHVLRSKHYKPAEHCWYFTTEGLVIALAQCGFALVTGSMVETELGREDIGTFAFKRTRDA
jgi:Methyltransferase domain